MITLRDGESLYFLTADMEWVGTGPMLDGLNALTQLDLLPAYDPSKGSPRLYVAQRLAEDFKRMVLFEDESETASEPERIY